MDAGPVLVNVRGACHGYLPEAELEFALEADEAEGETPTEYVHLIDGVL